MRNTGFLKGAFAGVMLVAIVSSGLALAVNPFVDVPSEKFYADAVDWAFNNGITTGSPAGSDTFKPEDPVTRGENVTFAKRYDDFIVQPALAALPDIYTARVNSAGTLVTGSPGVTSTRTGTGAYDVTFPVDVDGCIWNATPTSPGGVFFLIDTTEVYATVTGGTTSFIVPVILDPDLVTVTIFDEDGVLQDWRFDLTVVC